MENFTCFNFTSHTLVSNGTSISFFNVIEGVFGTAIAWTCCAYVIYISYFIINYLIEKVPNTQTILDGFYVQYFAAYIGSSIACIFSQFLIEMNAVLNLEIEALTWTVSYIFYSSFLFESLSLVTSCVARAFSIFCASEIETINDQTCWLLNG